MDMAEETMLLSLTIGAEATGGGFADLVKLEEEFMSSLGDLLADVVSPRDDPDVMMTFLTWIVTKKERALSLDTLWRSMGTLCARTRPINVTLDKGVKAFYNSLRELHGEESHPRTAATRRMVRALFETVLPQQISNPLLRKRAMLLLALEVLCGLRVGEALGGGDHHGLLANNVRILKNISSGETSVEVQVEHSKTKHSRWINAVGLSEGEARVPLAWALREYWKISGFTVKTWAEGGYEVTGTDYSVVRVSLMGLGMNAAEELEHVERLFQTLSESKDPYVRMNAAASKAKGMQRFKQAGSMDKKYINVIGGPSDSKSIATVMFELAKAGFAFYSRIVPGPLLRATHGSINTHMPLNPQSSYAQLHDAMDAAFAEANRDSPDPELDLQGLEAPLWGHHSFHRFADTVARQTMAETGATEQDIDLTFGWQEKFYSEKMQIHYQTKFTRESRRNVTKMI